MRKINATVEWFRPTSGTVVGWLGVAVAALMLVFSFGFGQQSGFTPAGFFGALLIALACWVTMLRPRVGLTANEVVVRGMVSTTSLPLAGIETIVVRQVLAMWVGGRRYVCAAIGRSYREIARIRRHPGEEPTETDPERARSGKDPHYADHVAHEIEARTKQALGQRGITRYSEEQAALAAEVRRTWAWAEILGLVVLTLALVLSFAL